MTKTPDQIYGELFEAVQLGRIFKDSKYFVDLIPRFSPKKILTDFHKEKEKKGFNLKDFVHTNFTEPTLQTSDFQSDTYQSLTIHIERLWGNLTFEADEKIEGSSLIPLPYPYIIPGGRFKELYYWDSYFTMLGLAESGKVEMIENMVKNFAYLLDRFGHIPNGNRTYLISRSQPPFFALMVDLLAQLKGEEVLIGYLPFLEKEYEFWMSPKSKRTVKVNDFILNRYFDNKNFPREESYEEDVKLKGDFPQPMLHLRAACESGWDFSSRWLDDNKSLKKIRTVDILPVDLNCLLYFLEKTIYKGNVLRKDENNSEKYLVLYQKREQAIQEIFYHKKNKSYVDFNVEKGQLSQLTLAMLYPLFFKIATQEQADAVAEKIENQFLHEGGLVTTLLQTNQQWDFPNGWAPLQWIAVKGLAHYGHQKLAIEISQRWCKLNEKVFQSTGQMMEKYNVVDLSLEAGGGEYDVQEGFGWSNGVYLALKAFFKSEEEMT